MSRVHRTCQRGCYTSCSTKTAMNLNQANNCCLWYCSWSIGAARFCSATWIWQLQVAASFLVGFCDCGFSWSCGWRRCSAQLTHFLMCLSASLQPISAHNRRKRTVATIQQVCQVPARKWRQYTTQQKFTYHGWAWYRVPNCLHWVYLQRAAKVP